MDRDNNHDLGFQNVERAQMKSRLHRLRHRRRFSHHFNPAWWNHSNATSNFFPSIYADRITDLNWKLFKAAKFGNDEELSFILTYHRSEVNIDLKISFDAVKSTPLHEACRRGAFKCVVHLVEAGCDVNIGDGVGRTALHHAAERGDVQMVKYLLHHHACADAYDDDQRTPLLLAARLANPAIAEALLAAAPANSHVANARSTLTSSNPLTEACIFGSARTLEVIAKYPKTTLRHPREKETSILTFVITEGLCDRYRKCEVLIRCILEKYGRDELFCALSGTRNGPRDIWACPLAIYTPLDAVCCPPNRNATAPLHKEERYALMRLLMKAGLKIHWFDRRACPMDHCIRNYDYEGARILLVNGYHRMTYLTFQHLVRISDEKFFNLIFSIILGPLMGSLPKELELTLATPRMQELFQEWMTQPRSLKHLARAAWLKRKVRIDHDLSREEESERVCIPERLRNFLLLKDYV